MGIEVSAMDPAGTLDDTEKIPGIQGGLPVFFTPNGLHQSRFHNETDDPTSADNTAAGYPTWHFWRNTTSGHVWLKVAESAGTATWVDLTEIATPGDVTNEFTGNVDGAGYKLFDVLLEGFKDKPYDLSTDALGLETTGDVQLIDDLNLVYHSNVTSALTLFFPTVTAGEAPYGTFSYILGTGGSVEISSGEDYEWEKVNTTDDDYTLPTVEGEGAHIYYRYDPVTERYLVSVTRVGTSAGVSYDPLGVIANSFQSTTGSNSDTKTHTHTFQMTEQDGTRYVIFGYITDAVSSVEIVPDGDLTEIVTMTGAESDGTRAWWGYYKPSQGEIDAGDMGVVFGMTNEAGTVVSFEITGAHQTAPIADTARNVSNTSRTSVSAVTLTAATDGSMLVAALGTDDSTNLGTITPAGTSGWDELMNYQPGTFQPAIIIYAKEGVLAGNTDTPSFTSTNADEQGLLAFAIEPAAA